MTTLEEGTAAVRLARDTLESCLHDADEQQAIREGEGRALPPLFDEKRGLFVTLMTHPASELRGCIGFPESPFRLREGIPRAALYAACEDPRFPRLVPRELPGVRVEVSLLTRPEPVVSRRPEGLPALVQIGRDGLIVAEDGMRGVLLPQVPVEEEWDAETFLSHTCRKAGLSPAAWKRDGPKFWKFQSEIFAEEAPRGKVVEHTLNGHAVAGRHAP